MDIARAKVFLARLCATSEDEIGCADLEAIVARYAEATARGDDLGAFGKKVPDHLFQCPDCSDVVSSVAYLAALEADNRLPTASALWSDLRAGFGPADGRAQATGQSPAAYGTGLTRFTRSSITSRTGKLLPAFLTVGALIAAIGWAESASRARDADRVVEALGQTTAVRSVPMSGSGQARLFFDSSDRRAVIHMDATKLVVGSADLEGRLRRRDGTTAAVRVEPCAGGLDGWWMLEADSPMAGFDVLAVNNFPGGQAIIELPLLAANR